MRCASPHSWSLPAAIAFNLPALLLVLGAVVLPALWCVAMAAGERGVVTQVVHDPRAIGAIGRTLLFAAVTVPLEMALGLALALLLSLPFRGRGLVRAAALVPWVLPSAVMATAWNWILHDSYGAFGDLLARAGVAERGIAWLGRPTSAFLCTACADVWKTTPFVAIILLAGLATIPRDLYEALSIDGGGAWERFRHVTLPLLRPYLATALAFRAIQALGLFDLVWALTRGGPGGATETLSLYIYDQMCRYGNAGYGAALTVVLSLLMLAIGGGLAAVVGRRRR